jgi:hypothetical protein
MEYTAQTVRFMTDELEQALSVLTKQQQDVIIQVVLRDRYTGDRALIPWKYIGTGKLVSKETYTGAGWQDEAGKWHDQGWHHQDAFVYAVKLAKRAVLRTGIEEGLAHVAKAKDKARSKMPRLTGLRIDIAESPNAKDSDRLKAIKDNEDLAMVGLPVAAGDDDQAHDDAAGDWWRAAMGGDSNVAG